MEKHNVVQVMGISSSQMHTSMLLQGERPGWKHGLQGGFGAAFR